MSKSLGDYADRDVRRGRNNLRVEDSHETRKDIRENLPENLTRAPRVL